MPTADRSFAPAGSRLLVVFFIGPLAGAVSWMVTLFIVSRFTRGALLLVLPLAVTAVVLARVGAVGVSFRGDELVVRNSFKTETVSNLQITAMDVVGLPWGMSLPRVAALRVAAPASRTVKVYATASLEGERTIGRFRTLVETWQRERLDEPGPRIPSDDVVLPEER